MLRWFEWNSPVLPTWLVGTLSVFLIILGCAFCAARLAEGVEPPWPYCELTMKLFGATIAWVGSHPIRRGLDDFRSMYD